MICEGIITTLGPENIVNIAPMGPEVAADWSEFVLKPFKSSQTYRNLKYSGEGVFHVTDDVLLIARAAIGNAEDLAPVMPAAAVKGVILQDCCRFYEFRVVAWDDKLERARLTARVVRSGKTRDFFGFNRAKHAVVEAAILATRTGIIPPQEIRGEFARLEVLVQKTGSAQEKDALALLVDFVNKTNNRQAR